MRPSNRTTPARTGPKSSAASAQLQLPSPEPKAGEPGQKLAEKQQQSNATEPNTNALGSKKKRKAKANEPKIELARLLQRICGVDLTRVVGLNVASVLLIVSEIGVDMSKWRTAKAFSSWLVCAQPTKSAEAKCSTRAPAKWLIE